jgi:7-keto-8-aminopelargonate synthetase-like enzyme
MELLRISSPSGGHMVVDGRPLLNFGGSCYLGLSSEPELVEAAVAALQAGGPMAQLPRHYGFAQAANLDVEATARAYFDSSGAMFFATGYLFGLVVLSALADDYDIVLLDESAHYNLRDGALAAGKPIRTFRHRDAADLARRLQEVSASGARPLVATDGMFATYGSIPPLAAYRDLLAPHDGWLVVDESHSFGVIGPTGRGACEAEGVTGRRVVAGGSLGKAFCAYGGIAVGDAEIIERLWRTPAARGAASGMASGAAMADASMAFMRRHPERLTKLRQNVAYLKERLEAIGLAVDPGDAPVIAFTRGSAQAMSQLQAELMAEGIFVIYSTYVGAGPDGAIRIAAFADHEKADIDRLVAALERRL